MDFVGLPEAGLRDLGRTLSDDCDVLLREARIQGGEELGVQLALELAYLLTIQRVVIPRELLGLSEQRRLADFVSAERKFAPRCKIQSRKLRQL